MKFLDQVKICVTSGNGGNGCVSFRREKYIEYGGPDGGNGGKGSDIIFQTNKNLNTLIDFRYKQHFKGKSGEKGKGKNKTGANAKDIIIKVPPGTQILSEDKSVVVYDMINNNENFVFVRGGKGGLGNSHYKSSTNRAPRKFSKGESGFEIWIWLSLKLIADVGIIGLPNAGKSTLLRKISSAKPKIADYPFTTLYPVLGVVKSYDDSFIIADIPGLIKGAHSGKGLGYRFLAHIERCKIILHLVDLSSQNIIENYNIVRSELRKYGSNLNNKKEIIALNKLDISDKNNKIVEKKLHQITKNKILSISKNDTNKIDELISIINNELNKLKNADI